MRYVCTVFFVAFLANFGFSLNVDGDFVLVEGSTFYMGTAGGKDNPIHKVSINSFYISKYELTVGEWREYIEDSGYEYTYMQSDAMLMVIARGYGYILPDNHPMYYITWREATEYCNWLSLKKNLDPVYTYSTNNDGEIVTTLDTKANGYRLPTEAEWEYAASGGVLSRSYKFSGSDDLDSVAWDKYNSDRVLKAVGLKKPNELGIYDMNGNVSEFTWDYYDDSYYLKSELENPTGPAEAYSPTVFKEFKEYFGLEDKYLKLLRTARGGNIRDAKESANPLRRRYMVIPGSRSLNGFRLVRNKY